VASTIASAVRVFEPSVARTVQVRLRSSHSHAVTVVSNTMWRSMSKSLVVSRRYSRISALGEHSRDQSVRWAYEYE
jgi:hypothetical protein